MFIGRWVNCTQSFRKPGCSFYLMMLPSSISGLQGPLRKGRKRAKDFMSSRKCGVHHSCPHSTYHSPVTGLHPNCKEAGKRSCLRKLEQGCEIHSPVSGWFYYIVHESLWLLISLHLLLWLGKLYTLTWFFSLNWTVSFLKTSMGFHLYTVWMWQRTSLPQMAAYTYKWMD